jgi:hypothetical protein
MYYFSVPGSSSTDFTSITIIPNISSPNPYILAGIKISFLSRPDLKRGYS